MSRRTTPFELVRPGILMAQRIAEANMMLALRMWGMAAAWKMAATREQRAEVAKAEAPHPPARPMARHDAAGGSGALRPRTPAPARRSRRAAGGQA